MSWFGVSSYSVAAFVYGLFAAVLLASRPDNHRVALLAATALVSSLWALGCATLPLWSAQPSLFARVALDAVHAVAWVACAASWLPRRRANRWYVLAATAAGTWALLASSSFAAGSGGYLSAYPALAGIALLGLIVVERVFRQRDEELRQSFRLLCFAASGVFLADLLVYAQAAIRGELLLPFWEARGVANAALAPLLVVAVKRQPDWETELHVSRDVVFYSVSLLGVAGYLLGMTALAYVIQALGWRLSPASELLFSVAVFALLLFAFMSTGVRARFKVFLLKHFYRTRYDYRAEWLRLTDCLGQTAEPRALAANALGGLARVVGSERADLWLSADLERYERVATLDREAAAVPPIDARHPVVKFLAANGWVIDSDEYRRHPDRYGRSFGDPADGVLPPDSVIVPLDCLGRLQGFVALHTPQRVRPLNFEDHDLLKTAGKQVAVALAQASAQERLAETRQFEAMNKLSTFLMHDLKNVIAQQELVVTNAQHFRHRKDFIDDAFTTIRSGVERMKKVLTQLKAPVQADAKRGRVDVSKLLMEIRSQCADRTPVPEIALDAPPAWVGMDRDKLASVLTHLIRNSQDATPDGGKITVGLAKNADRLVISVTDNGCGMDSAFVRERLFRPFDSTKGAKGMGIGAYQVRHIVRSAGGEVDVRSEPGVGTTFEVRLPCLQA